RLGPRGGTAAYLTTATVPGDTWGHEPGVSARHRAGSLARLDLGAVVHHDRDLSIQDASPPGNRPSALYEPDEVDTGRHGLRNTQMERAPSIVARGRDTATEDRPSDDVHQLDHRRFGCGQSEGNGQ